MPMTNPGGGGATSLSALTDVDFADVVANDGYGITFNFRTKKFEPTFVRNATPMSIDLSQLAGAITVSNFNFNAQMNITGFGNASSVAGPVPRKTGRYYFEANWISGAGDLGLGLADSSFTFDSDATQLGGDNHAVGAGTSGGIRYFGANIGSIGATNPTAGAFLGLAVDLDAKKIWVWNPAVGQWNGDVIANQNPVGEVGGISIAGLLTGEPVYPGMYINNLTLATFNLGGVAPFQKNVPGFLPWDFVEPSLLTPAFSAFQSAAQTLASSTFTKLQFQTKEFDITNSFDAVTNYRFQPTLPGYYQVNGAVEIGTTQTQVAASIFKNGAEFKRGGDAVTTNNSNVSALIFLNGESDYIELFGFFVIGQTTSAVQATTYFQAAFIRGAN